MNEAEPVVAHSAIAGSRRKLKSRSGFCLHPCHDSRKMHPGSVQYQDRRLDEMMADVDPRWSLDALFRDFQPHDGWRRWFSEAYAHAMESTQPDEQLKGWKTAAIILGDMHACLLCLFVCHHGRSLVPSSSDSFLGHIDLCLWEMGLASPTQPGDVLIGEVGKAETFDRADEVARVWLESQLQPFNGELKRAAEFAMGLTAIRLGLMRGPNDPSIEQIMDRSMWQRVGVADFGDAPDSATSLRKPWWQFWR